MENKMIERVKGIEFAVIPKLKEGERLVAYVDIGDLPSHKAIEFVEKVKSNMLKGEWAKNPDQYVFVGVKGQSSLSVDFKLESDE
jgi:hypothetical protein